MYIHRLRCSSRVRPPTSQGKLESPRRLFPSADPRTQMSLPPQRRDDPSLPPPWQALYGTSPACLASLVEACAPCAVHCSDKEPRCASRRPELGEHILLEPSDERDPVRASRRRSSAARSTGAPTALCRWLPLAFTNAAAAHSRSTPQANGGGYGGGYGGGGGYGQVRTRGEGAGQLEGHSTLAEALGSGHTRAQRARCCHAFRRSPRTQTDACRESTGCTVWG
jgi:hypothetical protein